MSDKYFLPRTLDAPFKFVVLTIDELILFVVPFLLLSLVFNALLSGFIVGILLVLLVRKIKGEQGHYFLLNLMYWHLPELVRLRVTPPSYIRRYLG